jgi:hypothetical protein
LLSVNTESVEVADQGVYKGKEGVKRYYLRLLGSKPPKPGTLSLQMQLQGVVTVAQDGKNARGHWCGWAMEALPTGSIHDGDLRQVWTNGIYENEYIKEYDRWMFKKLQYNLILRAPYEDGWLKTPVVGQICPSIDVTPDAPPTAYHPYPSRLRVPYHYHNPVTGKE